MNTLAIKKRAEVAAFVSLAAIILERTGPVFAGKAGDCHAALSAIAGLSPSDISGILEPAAGEIFAAKAAKTTSKLTAMMELYVGDEWHNPTEVLEWCSFYAGAGAAHCAIAGKLAADTELTSRLRRLETDFRQLLDMVIRRLAS